MCRRILGIGGQRLLEQPPASFAVAGYFVIEGLLNKLGRWGGPLALRRRWFRGHVSAIADHQCAAKQNDG
jgi:hypothetical protein